METNKITSTRAMIKTVKYLYETDGLKECGKQFEKILDAAPNNEVGERVARMVEQLIAFIYKMDTCNANCFEDLETKDICTCDCNDESMSIFLKEITETTIALS